MSNDLLDLLGPPPGGHDRVFGVVPGIVTNNNDPDGLGRVRVRFPWLSGNDESWWARIAAPMAGPGRGLQLLPEVDDEVLVAFAHGDIRFPYVLGALWNGVDAPPESTPLDESGQVARRAIVSRAGHLIRLDDTDGAGRVEIVGAGGANRIVIDTAAGTVTVHADGDLVLESATGKVVVTGQSIELSSSGGDVTVTSAAGATLRASGHCAVAGSTVGIN
ncbi:uncharacterized protein involved in type VI secretion and phage assembly [Actinoplanes octamycinicus]|uniref:Uncharacterized protein involved in type VI secretion and phage assembly n=1 Tax=Actinoplanes octamycinicus TaxID=135948 RepID=A0A7W7MBR3_9ACTN|nr:phage baseplate assembly protein V [Actinoplanes octamycinicus]MBB4744075.1 uncharacterized protein involved in type VI secretion and phage assembly [Actinoplanes octamycinicus]GIE56968.1 phage tail protein [Actinoplanes octamycinicus]